MGTCGQQATVQALQVIVLFKYLFVFDCNRGSTDERQRDNTVTVLSYTRREVVKL